MNKESKLILGSVVASVVINLVLPALVKPFASKNQVSPPNGAHNLAFFDQLVHMLVHHAHVPVTSSLIVAVIVALSLVLGKEFAKFY